MGLTGALVRHRGAVALHRPGLPACQPHQVGLAAALAEPEVGEGVPKQVRVQVLDPGLAAPTAKQLVRLPNGRIPGCSGGSSQAPAEGTAAEGADGLPPVPGEAGRMPRPLRGGAVPSAAGLRRPGPGRRAAPTGGQFDRCDGRDMAKQPSVPLRRVRTVRFVVRSFSTNSRPALRAAACGGRPRAGSTTTGTRVPGLTCATVDPKAADASFSPRPAHTRILVATPLMGPHSLEAIPRSAIPEHSTATE
jgi:hypothetical protein